MFGTAQYREHSEVLKRPLTFVLFFSYRCFLITICLIATVSTFNIREYMISAIITWDTSMVNMFQPIGICHFQHFHKNLTLHQFLHNKISFLSSNNNEQNFFPCTILWFIHILLISYSPRRWVKPQECHHKSLGPSNIAHHDLGLSNIHFQTLSF